MFSVYGLLTSKNEYYVVITIIVFIISIDFNNPVLLDPIFLLAILLDHRKSI